MPLTLGYTDEGPSPHWLRAEVRDSDWQKVHLVLSETFFEQLFPSKTRERVQLSRHEDAIEIAKWRPGEITQSFTDLDCAQVVVPERLLQTKDFR